MSEPVILCEKLKKTFPSGSETLHILNGLDFSLEKEQVCTILGASGSGKSTFLGILGSLEPFDEGRVSVGGFDLGSMRERMLHDFRRHVVGFVFQFHFLLNDFTALENVAIPAYMAGINRTDAWNRARTLLDMMGLRERLDHYPSQLSGGERQRAAIARALINDPAVVLADEPTGNLDAANASAIRQLLAELPEKARTTLVIATHDAELAAIGSRSFLLKGGKLECLR